MNASQLARELEELCLLRVSQVGRGQQYDLSAEQIAHIAYRCGRKDQMPKFPPDSYLHTILSKLQMGRGSMKPINPAPDVIMDDGLTAAQATVDLPNGQSFTITVSPA